MEPPQNRSLDALHPDFREKLDKWLAAATAAGFDILVYETFRTPERQQWLFDAGRKRPPFGRYLTYTMDSCHRYGLAADLVPLKDGQADWNGYAELHRAVPPSDYGLELLDFEKPHLQIKGGQQYAKDHRIKRDVIVGSKLVEAAKQVAPNAVKIPLYSALSNQLIDTITLIRREDGTYKAYTGKE